MKKQFLQIDEERADASIKGVFSFLALHLGIYSTYGHKSADARKSARASRISSIFKHSQPHKLFLVFSLLVLSGCSIFHVRYDNAERLINRADFEAARQAAPE